jgi:type VI secretion system secreted protein Hcp
MLSFNSGGPQSGKIALSAIMSDSINMEVTGIKGENTDSFAKDTHSILSYTWASFSSFEQSSGSSKDSSSGRASFTEVSVLKQVDSASPYLFQACVDGTKLDEVIISHYKVDGGKAINYLELKLEKVVCSLYAFSGAVDQVPLEQLSFNFQKITMKFTEIKSDGTAGDTVEKGWDVVENREP